jgi:fluoroquinolone resistance protein
MSLVFKELVEPDKADYFDQLFEKLDCSARTIQNKLFEGCDFKDCNFDNANLLSCKFIDCEFTHCMLNTVVLINSMFSDIVFDNSKLMGVNWALAKWSQIKLSGLINFYSCNISHSSFFGLNLSEINIQECKVHDVDFREADLSRSNLTNSDFYQASFVRTKLVAADFSGAVNYNIDIRINDVKKAIFTFPDAINLLQHFEIHINGLPTSDF